MRCISQQSVNVTNDGEFFPACCLLPAAVYLDIAGPPHVPLTRLNRSTDWVCWVHVWPDHSVTGGMEQSLKEDTKYWSDQVNNEFIHKW